MFKSKASKTPLFDSLLETEAGRETLLRFFLNFSNIPMLLGSVESGDTSLLYWLTRTRAGQQILQQLFSDVSFRERLLQDPAFIPALLKIGEGGDNISSLFNLATAYRGYQILQQLLSDESFKERLLQDSAFIPALLENGESGYYQDHFMFTEQVKGCNAHCWLTVSILPAPQALILQALRANPWALRTLQDPVHRDTVQCFIPDERVIQTLLQQDQEASLRHSMFGVVSRDKGISPASHDTNPKNRG